MFGQGNSATPRPEVSLQRFPTPGVAQPFQQGGHGPGRPVMQHLSNQSGSQVYQTGVMHQRPNIQQVHQSGATNVGLYAHGSQHNNHGQLHYPPAQHNSQHPPQLGVQNLYHVPPPRGSLPPPPPLPSPSGYIMQPSGYQGFPRIQSPQQPLLASVVSRITQSETSSQSMRKDTQLNFTNPPPPLMHSSPSPVPLACPSSGLPVSDSKEHNPAELIAASESTSAPPSSVGCPVLVKRNGVDAAEHTLTSHSDHSSVAADCISNEGETRVLLVSGSLGMDNKSELPRAEAGPSSQLNSSTNGVLCSVSDSDMDMEDDIATLIEDLEPNDSRNDQTTDNLAPTENLDALEKLNGQSPEPASFSGLPGEGVVDAHLHEESSILKSPFEVVQGHSSVASTEKLCATNDNDILHTIPATDDSAILEKVGEPNPFSGDKSTTYEESNPVTLDLKEMAFVNKTEVDLKSSSTKLAFGKPDKPAKIDASKQNLCDKSQQLKSDDMASKLGNICVEDTKTASQLKVDEFGRLAKDVSSDSESEDLHYSRKRGRRGRSRSISPFDRRRKTPLRRRNNRSRSRSHSPLRGRSRSRSPCYRRPAESIYERRRRDKVQTSICFNFRDGRCLRGSSCRFLHHDSDRSGSSNSYKRKRLSEDTHGDKASNFQERSKGSSREMGSHKDDEEKNNGSQHLNSSKSIHPDSGRDKNVADTNYSEQRITVVDRAQFDQDDHTQVSYLDKREAVGREIAHAVEAAMSQVAPDQDATNLPGDDKYKKSAQSWQPYDAESSAVLSLKEPSIASHSADAPQHGNTNSQKSNSSYEYVSVQHNPSLGTPHLFAICDPRRDSVPSSSHSFATMDSRVQPGLSERPSLRVPSSSNATGTPISQAVTGRCMPQLQSSYGVMQTSAGLPSPFMPGSGPSYNQFPLHNQPQQSLPISNWTSLPPPPPPQASMYAGTPNANNSTSGNAIPYKFEWNQQPPSTGVAHHYKSGPHSGLGDYNSQYGTDCHENNHPSFEARRPPFAFSMQRPGSVYSHTQQTEGHHERNHHIPIQGILPSTFHVQPSTSFQGLIPSTFHVQPSTSDQPLIPSSFHVQLSNFSVGPSATETLPSSETVCHASSSKGDDILKNMTLNDPRNSLSSDSKIMGISGKIESSSLRSASGISEFEHPQTSVHLDMSAPTSDCPIASMSSQPQMIVARGLEEHGLREKSSCFPTKIAGQNSVGSGGGLYDPLFDSLEKSSNSIVNSERFKNPRSASDSDHILRGVVSNKPFDVEDTNRKKESEAIASLTSSDNEEFGETADAGVGALENESFSNPVDMPNRDSEVAISETYPDKKSKDSRSMKLFKSSIANFAKEVLKPSWRQGNMSKEAFKTIVKKTVEKVSGAMEGHRYPKSRAKINRYIDSSERKLTKLVMGYVDKYVKV